MEQHEPTRRRVLNWFMNSSLGALVLAVVYPIARFVNPPEVPEAATEQVEAGATNDPALLESGFKIIRFGEDPVIVIRVSPTDIRAFSAVCTHLACIVEYQQKQTRIFCNCHNGVYDLNGRVIAGPPPKPLKKFDVNLVARAGSQAKTIVVSRA